MRRLRGDGPALLVVLGALLGIGVVVGVLLTRHEARREAGPSSTTTTAPSTTTSTVPQPQPVPLGAPVDLHVTSLTSSSATLAWRTAVPTVGHVAVGTPALGPTRWLAPTPSGVEHEVSVTELAF